MPFDVTRFTVSTTGSPRVMSPIVIQATPALADVQFSESVVEGVAPAIRFATCFSRGAGQRTESSDDLVRGANPDLRESQHIRF